MEKIGHLCHITKNSMFLHSLWKYEIYLYQEGCQETYGNIKDAAGIFGKYLSLPAFNNTLS